MATEQRSLLSRSSTDWQTGQLQPIWGMPVEVPVPRNRIFIVITFKKSCLIADNGQLIVSLFASHGKREKGDSRIESPNIHQLFNG